MLHCTSNKGNNIGLILMPSVKLNCLNFVEYQLIWLHGPANISGFFLLWPKRFSILFNSLVREIESISLAINS